MNMTNRLSSHHVTLNSGHNMPLVGLGCSMGKLENESIKSVILEALRSGYRLFDCSPGWAKEPAVGKALTQWSSTPGNSRDQLFVITKLPPYGNRPENIEKYLRASLGDLQLSYVDLYLIHMPFGLKHKDGDIPSDIGSMQMDFSTDHIAIWKMMEKMVDLGLTKSIGLSNFGIRQIRKICAVARIPPAVVEVELHGCLQQEAMRELCSTHNIQLLGFAPFGSPHKAAQIMKNSKDDVPGLLDEPVVKLIADNHNARPGQVLLRFLLQLGAAVIPLSTNKERLDQNMDVWQLNLSDTEMAALKSLDRGEAGRIYRFLSFTEHPEFPH